MTRRSNRIVGSLVLASSLSLSLSLASCGDPASRDDADGTTNAETGAETETETDTDTETETGEEPDPVDYGVAGPHPVGNVAFELSDPVGDRPLQVEVWYPASDAAFVAAELGQALTVFAEGDDAASLAALVEVAPDECVRKQTRSALEPALADAAGPWPTVVFSHCHGCARFSSYSLAERLASHGFLVAAVDHAGSTLFDAMEGGLPPLDTTTLQLRRDDVIRVIDELLDPSAGDLPASLVGFADADRLGVFGHSFGAITTGLVLQDDPRPKAGVAIAAPIESPLLQGVTMAAITEPLLLMIAVEDNSITEFGNNLIRSNFTIANTPVWKIELADTGHFSFSDLAGLNDTFAAGCGEGLRQTNDEPFTYVDPFEVRELTATRVTAFFAHHLLADPDALAQLEAPDPLASIDVRE